MAPGMLDRLYLVRVLTILVLAHLAGGEDVCHDLGESCMFMPLSEVTWESATKMCELLHPKARLLSIDSAAKQKKISVTLQRLNVTDKSFWVGGRQEATHWHWVVDKSPLTCYMGSCSIVRDKKEWSDSSIYRNSAAACSQTCRAKGFTKAYLQERTCICGNDLCGTVVSKNGRQKTCPGDPQDSCGNKSSHLYSVYTVSDFRWTTGGLSLVTKDIEPGRACATVVNDAFDRRIRLTDKLCDGKQKAICQYESNVSCDRGLSRDLCLWIINTPSTWFEARATCREGRGDLAVLKGENSVNVSALELWRHYWIGLWRLSETWTSGEDITFRPNPISVGCLLITTGTKDLIWTGADCLLQKEYICEKKKSEDDGEESTTDISRRTGFNCPLNPSTKGPLHESTSEDGVTETTSKDHTRETDTSPIIKGIVAVCPVVIITLLGVCMYMYRSRCRTHRNGQNAEEMVQYTAVT
ncbi:uncharacterized protein LOC135462035 [Liolophura sinensis]|uniref:uncharacterized protein LOC135462035 n=1 Tax=Liolophura sinensis TaxID=3198878 RepID=UPI0031596EAB